MLLLMSLRYIFYNNLCTTHGAYSHNTYNIMYNTQESKKEICEKGFKHDDGETDKVNRISIADLEKLLK